jgi:hypothetical protein
MTPVPGGRSAEWSVSVCADARGSRRCPAICLAAALVLGAGLVRPGCAADVNLDSVYQPLPSSYSIALGTDYQNGQDLSLSVDQGLKSRNRFQFSLGRSRLDLSTGTQDSYTAAFGMSTDPADLYAYGVGVKASYLGPNLKSRSLTGAWGYAGDDWQLTADPVARIISFYKPPPLPKTTDVFGLGTALSATRFVGDAWSLAVGGEYYKYWGDSSVLPVIIRIVRSGGKLPYLSGFLRERYWLESGYDGRSSSFIVGADSSLTVLSKQRVNSAYVRSIFDLSRKLSLNTEIGASNFETSNWYLATGLSWTR